MAGTKITARIADEISPRGGIQRCDIFKMEQKSFSETALCGQRVRKMMSEGMGSAIPIKVAEGRTKRKMRKVSDTGESCPKKVMAPQICENSQTSPLINHRKNVSKATPGMCSMKNSPTYLSGDGSLPPEFSGVSGRRYCSYGRKEIVYSEGITGDSPGQQAGGL